MPPTIDAGSDLGESRAKVSALRPPRVESLDLLRGLCALGVACYHVGDWLELPVYRNLGRYGVYLFFILSGASMTLAYASRMDNGYPYWKYIAARYLRLWPLYTAVVLFAVAAQAWHSGGLDLELAFHALLNITLTFGLANPGTTSLVTGGWSIGIEFVFYLVFPLLLGLRKNRGFVPLVLAAVVCQVVFVHAVLGGASALAEVWSAYTQFGAFVGYFCVGVLLGELTLRRAGAPWSSQTVAWVGWVVLIVLVIGVEGPRDVDTLIGWRALLLVPASAILVWTTAGLRIPEWLAPTGRALGDVSFALYLLHPVVFWLLRSRHTLRGLSTASPLGFAVVVVITSLVLSLATYRLFERPILAWGKRRLAAGGN